MPASAQDRWLKTAAAGMELSWRLAWANWLTVEILSKGYPAGSAALVFLAAAVIRAGTLGRGFRLITVIGLHLGGLILAGLLIVHHFHGLNRPWWPLDWLSLAAAEGQGIFWASAVFEVFLTVVLWTAGAAWSGRGLEYQTVSRRFDLGLSMLFLLFIVKYFLMVRFEHQVRDPQGLLLVAAFICFGLLGLALARIRGGSIRRTGGRAGGLWTVAGVGAGGFLISGGAIAFFLPQLTTAAEAGYRVLKWGGRPLLDLFVAVLLFLYGPRRQAPELAPAGGGSSTMNTPAMSEDPAWLVRVMEVAAWILLGWLVLMATAVTALLIYHLIRRLLTRTETQENAEPWGPDWRKWAARLADGWSRLKKILTPPADAPALYRWLQRWGRAGGRARRVSETPREYARRLESSFPAAAGDIRTMVSLLERQVYAGQAAPPEQLAAARRGRRRLAGLKWWPRRLKTRLLN